MAKCYEEPSGWICLHVRVDVPATVNLLTFGRVICLLSIFFPLCKAYFYVYIDTSIVMQLGHILALTPAWEHQYMLTLTGHNARPDIQLRVYTQRLKGLNFFSLRQKEIRLRKG